MDSNSREQNPCARNAKSQNRIQQTEMDATTLLNSAVAHLGPAVPTAQSLMRIGVTLAQEVNRATDLPGRAKLDLVIHTLRDLLAVPAISDRLSPEMVGTLRNIVDTVIPETISLVVEASRGAFSLKKPSVGCLAGVAALLCRQLAAHGPAHVTQIANQIAAQADQVAKDEKEPDVATSTTVAKDTIELTLRDVVQSKAELTDAPNPDSA
jgi:hypothetical protein